MAIKTFIRFELKYILSEAQHTAMLKGIEKYAEADAYCIGGKSYGLYNIYYDTDDYSVIRYSNSKPPFKEKLRLRSYYENPAPEQNVFVELKKKTEGCVSKRRATMPFAMATEFLRMGVYTPTGDYVQDTVLREIQHYLKIHSVKPVVMLSYNRSAYFLKDDKKIRITFDTDIKASPVSDVSDAISLLPDNQYLMEIKIGDHLPLWLAHLLTQNGIFRHSFSKYGTYYNEIISRKDYADNVRTY